jgi:hypothetical protein
MPEQRADSLREALRSLTGPGLQRYLAATASRRMELRGRTVVLPWMRILDTHCDLSASNSFSPTADPFQLTVRPQRPERSDVEELGAK